uniref:Uncharacterized protein n=1 Tax=Arundo donax TaxID=35708 RepID=A0A0A9E045_ARUDO
MPPPLPTSPPPLAMRGRRLRPSPPHCLPFPNPTARPLDLLGSKKKKIAIVPRVLRAVPGSPPPLPHPLLHPHRGRCQGPPSCLLACSLHRQLLASSASSPPQSTKRKMAA